MADIAISYSSKNKEKALKIRNLFQEQGLEVWMDDAADNEQAAADISKVGIAAGANHWDVISRFFSEASLIVCLDTAFLRQSEYCLKEYQFVKELRKRIAVISEEIHETYNELFKPVGNIEATSVDEIVDQFNHGHEISQAHSRLISAQRYPDEQASGRTGWKKIYNPIPEQLILDARTVISGASQRDFANDEKTISFAQEILRNARKWNFRRDIIAIGVVAVVAVLSLLANISFQTAGKQSANAQHSEKVQKVLLLSQQALDSTNTWNSLSLAKQAYQTLKNSNSTAAMNLAQNQQKQIAHTNIKADTYYASSLSADGSALIEMTQSSILRVNLSTGKLVNDINVVNGKSNGGTALLGQTLRASSNGKHAVVAMMINPKVLEYKLIDVDFAKNTFSIINGTDTVAGFDIDANNNLWWTTKDKNTVSSLAFPWSGKIQTYQTVSTTPTAIAVDSVKKSLWLLEGNNGNLTNYSFSLSTLTKKNRQAVYPDTFKAQPIRYLPRSTGQFMNDSIDLTKNGLVATREGAVAYYDFSTEKLKKDTQTFNNPNDNSIANVETPPACLSTGAVYFSGATGQSRVLPTQIGNPILPVLDGNINLSEAKFGLYNVSNDYTGTKLAITSNSGDIYLVNTKYSPNNTAVTGAYMCFYFGSSVYTIDEAGNIQNSGTGDIVGNVGTVPLQTLVTEKNNVYLIDGQNVLQLSQGSDRKVVSKIIHSTVEISSLVQGSENSLILIGSSQIGILDLENEKITWLTISGLQANETLRQAAMSFDGSKLALSTTNQRILLIDIKSGKILKEATQGSPYYDTFLAYNDLGELVAYSADGTLVKYNSELRLVAANSLNHNGVLFTSNDRKTFLVYSGGSFTALDSKSLDELQYFNSTNTNRYSYYRFALNDAGDRLSIVGSNPEMNEQSNSGLVQFTVDGRNSH